MSTRELPVSSDVGDSKPTAGGDEPGEADSRVNEIPK
jgi:hypothetical protein